MLTIEMLKVKSAIYTNEMTDHLQILNGENLILSWVEADSTVKDLSQQLKLFFETIGIECVYIDNEDKVFKFETLDETPATNNVTIYYNYDNIVIYYNYNEVLAWHYDFCQLAELYDQLLELFQLLKIEYMTGK